MQRVRKLVRETGAYSREAAIARPAARTKEARYLNSVRDQLTDHLGGKTTAVQKFQIERIAMTMLRIELMDSRALKDRDIGERQARDYLAWNNTVSRMLFRLGAKKMPDSPSLHDDYDDVDWADKQVGHR